MTTVYLVMAQAVYDHGPLAVCTTREKAERAVELLTPINDGHHTLEIEELAVDVVLDRTPLLTGWQSDSRVLGLDLHGEAL